MKKRIIVDSYSNEFSTDQIMKYLVYLDADAELTRINAFELDDFGIRVENAGVDIKIGAGEKKLELEELAFYFYRRGTLSISGARLNKSAYAHGADNFFRNELKVLKEYVYSELENRNSYGSWHADVNANKLIQLKQAVVVGMNIPSTLITTSKEELLKFQEDFCQVIIKPIGDHIDIPIEAGCLEASGTQQLSKQDILSFEDHFFPALLQEKVEKSFEVRSYYFNQSIHSMAIFSQASEATKLDFRNYDEGEKNRNVPYQLSEEMETKVHALMKRLRLDTGSLDFMFTSNNEIYFLEVNPTGQFGWVSENCNYQFEKRYA